MKVHGVARMFQFADGSTHVQFLSFHESKAEAEREAKERGAGIASVANWAVVSPEKQVMGPVGQLIAELGIVGVVFRTCEVETKSIIATPPPGSVILHS